jgi:MYXO-CTERM domain-containing protein
MRTIRSIGSWRVARLCGLVVGTGSLLVSAAADAHFVLKAPANWAMQDSFGGPQKMGPCGNEAPQTPTNAVTPYQPGDQVMIQLDETIFHPGHYRVALAATQSQLPPEPVVTPTAQDQCASAAVQDNPTLPILQDNLLVHTAPFTGTQSFTVTLPTNPPCTDCVLQVLEFMSSHGAPCFYHHCANITIGDAPGDAGGGSGGSNSSAATSTDGGCSCSVPGRNASRSAGAAALALLVALGVATRRRSR